MLEREIIQNRGFENVIEEGKVTGFRFLLRMPNYRGVYARLIDGVDVRVDDVSWPRDVPLWTLHGTQYSLQELQDSHLDVHWDLDEPATISAAEAQKRSTRTTTFPLHATEGSVSRSTSNAPLPSFV